MTWAVTFMDKDIQKVRVDTLPGIDRKDALRSFFACYRHGNYTILSVVKVPQ